MTSQLPDIGSTLGTACLPLRNINTSEPSRDRWQLQPKLTRCKNSMGKNPPRLLPGVLVLKVPSYISTARGKGANGFHIQLLTAQAAAVAWNHHPSLLSSTKHEIISLGQIVVKWLSHREKEWFRPTSCLSRVVGLGLTKLSQYFNGPLIATAQTSAPHETLFNWLQGIRNAYVASHPRHSAKIVEEFIT